MIDPRWLLLSALALACRRVEGGAVIDKMGRCTIGRDDDLLLNVKTEAPVSQLRGPSGDLVWSSLSNPWSWGGHFDLDRGVVYTVDYSGEILRFEVHSGAEPTRFSFPDARPRDWPSDLVMLRERPAFSPDGDSIYFVREGSVRWCLVRELEDGTCKTRAHQYRVPNGYVSSVAMSQRFGALFAVTSVDFSYERTSDKEIEFLRSGWASITRIRSDSTVADLSRVDGYSGLLFRLKVSPGGEYIAAMGMGPCVQTPSGQCELGFAKRNRWVGPLRLAILRTEDLTVGWAGVVHGDMAWIDEQRFAVFQNGQLQTLRMGAGPDEARSFVGTQVSGFFFMEFNALSEELIGYYGQMVVRWPLDGSGAKDDLLLPSCSLPGSLEVSRSGHVFIGARPLVNLSDQLFWW